VYASANYRLPRNVEDLHLRGDVDGRRGRGNSGDNALHGSDGDDLLFGHAGHDTLDGGAGDDLLVGGPGDDRYEYLAGQGEDRIRNRSWARSAQDRDTLSIRGPITPADVWFSRTDTHLKAELIGYSGSLLLEDWFSDPSARVDEIVLVDESRIVADQLERLIAAMAIFDVEAGSDIRLSDSQQDDYSALVAAHWDHGTAA
jgi:hypothetical protein